MITKNYEPWVRNKFIIKDNSLHAETFQSWEEFNAITDDWFRITDHGYDPDDPDKSYRTENMWFKWGYELPEDLDHLDYQKYITTLMVIPFKNHTEQNVFEKKQATIPIVDIKNPQDLKYCTIELTEDITEWNEELRGELKAFCNTVMVGNKHDWVVAFGVFHTDNKDYLSHLHIVFVKRQNYARKEVNIATYNRLKAQGYYNNPHLD